MTLGAEDITRACVLGEMDDLPGGRELDVEAMVIDEVLETGEARLALF
jgi:hypothetical protein